MALVTKSGDDPTGGIGGRPFRTINGAITAINAAGTSGILIFVFPGFYDETITIPAGNYLRGISAGAVIIRKQNVIENTTLLTMGENTRVEDISLLLTSSSHVVLKGVSFPGTTSQTSRLRSVIITVDNSTASSAGSSNVIGIHSFGTGLPDESASIIRTVTATVRSSGMGIKRTLLIDSNVNFMRCRDINFTCTNVGSGSGSYIGAEVNQVGAQLTIRMGSIQGTTADISQTVGTLNVGTTNLINSNANSLSFNAVQQPAMIIWADPGSLPNGATRFYRPGTASVSTTEVFIRLNQKAVIKSLGVRALSGPGGTNINTWTIRKNGVDTLLTVSLTGTQVSNVNSGSSVSFQAGDSISLKVVTSATTAITDTVVQVDVF
ncbi:hypothetical protein [Bacillus cereus]|uniref:hypothetical protein n=1 Tax=Bacillus cereus TaxID=1396 RepID=UPI000BEC6CB2|nr:hypothetical protein [Bacillus cereus]PEF60673.1 hypothetical protein CON35_29595 [Bacillus cereus]